MEPALAVAALQKARHVGGWDGATQLAGSVHGIEREFESLAVGSDAWCNAGRQLQEFARVTGDLYKAAAKGGNPGPLANAYEYYMLTSTVAGQLGDARAAQTYRQRAAGIYKRVRSELEVTDPATRFPNTVGKKFLLDSGIGEANGVKRLDAAFSGELPPDSPRRFNCQRAVLAGVAKLFDAPFLAGASTETGPSPASSGRHLREVWEYAFGAGDLDDIFTVGHLQTWIEKAGNTATTLMTMLSEEGSHVVLVHNHQGVAMLTDPQLNISYPLAHETFKGYEGVELFIAHDPKRFELPMDIAALAKDAHDIISGAKFGIEPLEVLQRRLAKRVPVAYREMLQQLRRSDFKDAPRIHRALATAEKLTRATGASPGRSRNDAFSAGRMNAISEYVERRGSAYSEYLNIEPDANPHKRPLGFWPERVYMASVDDRPTLFAHINNRPVTIDVWTRTVQAGLPFGRHDALSIQGFSPEHTSEISQHVESQSIVPSTAVRTASLVM